MVQREKFVEFDPAIPWRHAAEIRGGHGHLGDFPARPTAPLPDREHPSGQGGDRTARLLPPSQDIVPLRLALETDLADEPAVVPADAELGPGKVALPENKVTHAGRWPDPMTMFLKNSHQTADCVPPQSDFAHPVAADCLRCGHWRRELSIELPIRTQSGLFLASSRRFASGSISRSEGSLSSIWSSGTNWDSAAGTATPAPARKASCRSERRRSGTSDGSPGITSIRNRPAPR